MLNSAVFSMKTFKLLMFFFLRPNESSCSSELNMKNQIYNLEARKDHSDEAQPELSMKDVFLKKVSVF